uniref:Replication factor A C-terminal domain-containing protein n=1 Tax=Lactuca sativa TaxID=4236 RepID=A0A9R1URE0_LACSA|nr:hypothetical protein LSAT_V11C800412130 [Lactuca sativa]
MKMKVRNFGLSHNHSYIDPEKISETVVVECTNPHCKKFEFHTVIKYIIPINVQDCTGTIGLTLFYREAKRLLNIKSSQNHIIKHNHEERYDHAFALPRSPKEPEKH